MAALPPSETQKVTVHEIPDEDEEDLDDLDDLLHQFTPKAPATVGSPPHAPPHTTTHRQRTNTRIDAPPVSFPGSGTAGLDPTKEADEDALSADFAKELAKGMENLMREISGGTLAGDDEEHGGSGEVSEKDKEAEKAFKAAWEAMLVEGMDGMGGEGLDLSSLGELMGPGGVGSKGKGKEESAKGASGNLKEATDFQTKIQQAMGKLRESESTLQADSAPKSAPGGAGVKAPDSIESLLASLGDLGLGDNGEGTEDDAELAGFIENMMGQLMSKDVLYEPLKDLADNFPSYLANPPTPLSEPDRRRYETQLSCINKILAIFDKPGYSDSNSDTGKEIADLMSELQTYGSPPSEIMGELPPGMEGMGGDGCVIA